MSFRQGKDESVVAHALCAAGLWLGPFCGPLRSGICWGLHSGDGSATCDTRRTASGRTLWDPQRGVPLHPWCPTSASRVERQPSERVQPEGAPGVACTAAGRGAGTVFSFLRAHVAALLPRGAHTAPTPLARGFCLRPSPLTLCLAFASFAHGQFRTNAAEPVFGCSPPLREGLVSTRVCVCSFLFFCVQVCTDNCTGHMGSRFSKCFSRSLSKWHVYICLCFAKKVGALAGGKKACASGVTVVAN